MNKIKNVIHVIIGVAVIYVIGYCVYTASVI